MKYFCKGCDSMYCFDGSTEKTLPDDIKSHEQGWYHKHKLK